MSDRLAITADDRNALVLPVHPHRRHHLAVREPRCRARQRHRSRRSTRRRRSQLPPASRTSRWPARARRSTWPTWPRSGQHPTRAAVPERARAIPGGGAPKPPQLHYDIKDEIGGRRASCRGYGLTEAPIITMAQRRRHRRGARQHRGPGHARRRAAAGHARGQGGRASARRARSAPRRPQLMQGYLDSSLDAEAFDEDGWFRTGDLGRIDADGNVTITGRLKDIIIRKGENISRQGGRGPPLRAPEGRRRRGDRPARSREPASACARSWRPRTRRPARRSRRWSGLPRGAGPA